MSDVIQGLPHWYVKEHVAGEKVLYRDLGDKIEFRRDYGMCNGLSEVVATIDKPFPGAVPVCRELPFLTRAPYIRVRLYWEKPNV